MLWTAQSLPLQGLLILGFDARRFPPRRQPATGPPGSYPDRTHTGIRRRAYNQRSTTHSHFQLGARKIEGRAKRQGPCRPGHRRRHTGYGGWSTLAAPRTHRCAGRPGPAVRPAPRPGACVAHCSAATLGPGPGSTTAAAASGGSTPAGGGSRAAFAGRPPPVAVRAGHGS